MMGECREYNTITTPVMNVPKPTEPLSKPSLQDKVTEATKAPEITTVVSVSSTQKDVLIVEEHPLELEAVLSSTVNANDEKVADNKGDPISPEQKVSE